MKKRYYSPQTDATLLLQNAVLLYVSMNGTAPEGADAEAPARKEFKPSFDHNNLI